MAGRALPEARSAGREPAKCCIRGRVDSVRRWDERVHSIGSTESYSVDSAHVILAVIYMVFLLYCFDGIYTTMHSTGDNDRWDAGVVVGPASLVVRRTGHGIGWDV